MENNLVRKTNMCASEQSIISKDYTLLFNDSDVNIYEPRETAQEKPVTRFLNPTP